MGQEPLTAAGLLIPTVGKGLNKKGGLKAALEVLWRRCSASQAAVGNLGEVIHVGAG
jgi:hypothetical protein